MNTLTKDQLNNYELSHARGGNGYFMCEDLDKDYCRIAVAMDLGKRAFLAAKSQLSVFKRTAKDGTKYDAPIMDDVSELLSQVRSDIKSGKLAVFNSHVMPVAEAARLRKEFESK